MFAIGLPPVFSLRWNLPPALSCNPKQLDSFTRTNNAMDQEADGTVTLSDTLFQGTYSWSCIKSRMAQHPKVWQHGLFPLQSPLLRESLLVSFPPLNNMLKFSGSSYLIGDPSGRLYRSTIAHALSSHRIRDQNDSKANSIPRKGCALTFKHLVATHAIIETLV